MAGHVVAALKAPFPWFGGKSRVAPEVWERFGNVPNFVEPFFGSGAVLLGRPQPPGIETVNDKDGFVANFWRSLAADPEQTAYYADWPVNENDLHARHVWLKARRSSLVAQLEGEPGYYDAKVAGWWVWGVCCWIGSGFCGDSGAGPWQVQDGQLVHLGNAGQGVSRRTQSSSLFHYFGALAERLRFVRVCCGDWQRILGPSPTEKNGITGVFLDPPYSSETGRDMDLYSEDSGTVAHDVLEWAKANGGNPMLRIALCGYEGEHDLLSESGWNCFAWKTRGGYSNIGSDNGKDNAQRERIWFSPACLQTRLF